MEATWDYIQPILKITLSSSLFLKQAPLMKYDKDYIDEGFTRRSDFSQTRKSNLMTSTPQLCLIEEKKMTSRWE